MPRPRLLPFALLLAAPLLATPALADPAADARRANLERVVSLASEVPGEGADYLRDYVRKHFDPEPSPAPVEVLGRGFDAERLRRAFSLEHPSGEIRAENFVVVRSRDATRAVGFLAVVTDRAQGSPLGYFMQTYRRGADGQLSSFLDYIILDTSDARTKGLADGLLQGSQELARAAGVGQETLLAAYVGRYRWALDGYDFESPEVLAEFQQRFRRLLARYQIDPHDLVFQRSDGSTEPFSFERLRHSWDFAQVVSTRGKITLPISTGDLIVSTASLDVGKAFMLGDSYAEAPNSSGEVRELTAPDWSGRRSTDPRSPGVRQKEAYDAARAARSPAGPPAPPDELAAYRRADGTLDWGRLTRAGVLREVGGIAHFGLALFLKELAVVAATGDRVRIEEFFEGLLTTDFYKSYGLFVAGARVGEVAYTRYLQRYVKPQFVSGLLKTNLVLATGIALPMIVEGRFEGKAFAISVASLGLSSAAVRAGVAGLGWVLDLRKAGQAGTLARAGLQASRLARLGGWFYSVAELAVVLFVADRIEQEVHEYLDRRKAKQDLGRAGLRLVDAVTAPEATAESVRQAAQEYHDAAIAYRDFLYGPLHADEVLLAARMAKLARTAKLKADERATSLERLRRYPALARDVVARYGSLERYADARLRADEAEVEADLARYLSSYEDTRTRHLREVYEEHRRGRPLLATLPDRDWLLSGARPGAPGDPWGTRSDVFAAWGRDQARAHLADALGDGSRNRLEAYQDEAEVFAALADGLTRAGRADLALVLRERRRGVLELAEADRRLIQGPGIVAPDAGEGVTDALRRALGEG